MNLMKRVAEEDNADNRGSKRPKIDSTAVFRDPSQEKTATDLRKWTPGDSGYVSGKICRKWPLMKNRVQIKMEIFSLTHGRKQLEVVFNGTCAEEFRRRGFEFKIGQELNLSLKGAVMEKASLQSTSLPVAKYTDGVALEIPRKRYGHGITIDTWFQPPAVDVPAPVSKPDDDWLGLMDMDEDPALMSTSSPPAASKPSIGRRVTSCLANVYNSLRTIPRPIQLFSSSPSSYIRAIPPAIIHGLGIPLPQENLTYKDPRTDFGSSLSRGAHSSATESLPKKAHNPLPIPAITDLMDVDEEPALVAASPVSTVDDFLTPKEPQPPVLAVAVPDSMDIDEEPALVAASPPSTRKPVSKPSNAPKATNTNPLNNIHSSPRPTQNLLSFPSPSSHHIGLIPARPAAHKENHPSSKEAASAPARALTVYDASIAQPPDRAPAKRKQQKADFPKPAASSVIVPQTPTAIVKRNTNPVQTTPVGPTISSIVAPARSPQSPQPSPAATGLAPPHRFTRISKLDGSRRNTYSIMGIVTSSTPAKQTAKGDWSCSLRIVDTSNCNESYRPAKEGLLVNCFMKDRNWLPAAKPGDAVLLHNIKTSILYDNTVAIGYWDKLQWAVYDPATKQIGHGNSPHATESISLAGGYGVKFSSFFHGATEADLKYCVALDGWWREVEAKRLAAMGTIHQIGAEISSTSFRSSGSKREHRLISDLSVDRIGQYFDCTVRVIHGHPNGRTHRLYVTDGTPLQDGRPCQIIECPPSLVDCIMTIEMWDAACLQGPTVIPNQYYLLKNVRFMRGNDGYVEAKLVEAKIQKLEVDAVHDYPNLKALLELVVSRLFTTTAPR
ncbi:hypothetical protein B0H14DRAFT_2595232 [Mycena olivaceomarginata]|nr:hypothetical protein B0H14DRAFT_2595232 [Mycena olivaceomarginata]